MQQGFQGGMGFQPQYQQQGGMPMQQQYQQPGFQQQQFQQPGFQQQQFQQPGGFPQQQFQQPGGGMPMQQQFQQPMQQQGFQQPMQQQMQGMPPQGMPQAQPRMENFNKVEMEMIAWRIATYINYNTNDAMIKAQFDKYDDNKNGILERNEIKRMVNELFTQNVADAEANRRNLEYIIQRFDTDGNGEFNFQEFKNVSYYAMKSLAKQQLQKNCGTTDFTPLLTRYKCFLLFFFQQCTPEFIQQNLNAKLQGITDPNQKYNKIQELVS